MSERMSQARSLRKPSCNCGTCSACKRREYNRKYYEDHAEEIALQTKKRYETHGMRIRAQNRNYHRLRHFNLTTEEYNEQLALQGGVCARCGRPETVIDRRTGRVRDLSIDHCHSSLRFRKLLCCRCNPRIGGRETNLETLKGDIQYLMEHDSPAIAILRELLCQPLFALNPFV
jgi:hypothetical protein